MLLNFQEESETKLQSSKNVVHSLSLTLFYMLQSFQEECDTKLQILKNVANLSLFNPILLVYNFQAQSPFNPILSVAELPRGVWDKAADPY